MAIDMPAGPSGSLIVADDALFQLCGLIYYHKKNMNG
jgi:hypothetical protein